MERESHNQETTETPECESSEHEEGLASLVGSHSDDPDRQDIQKYIQEYRRQIDEANKG